MKPWSVNEETAFIDFMLTHIKQGMKIKEALKEASERFGRNCSDRWYRYGITDIYRQEIRMAGKVKNHWTVEDDQHLAEYILQKTREGMKMQDIMNIPQPKRTKSECYFRWYHTGLRELYKEEMKRAKMQSVQ